MKKLTWTLLPALFATLFIFESCSPFARVYSEEEPGVNLYQYHTYNWSDNTGSAQGNQGPEWLNESTQGKIRAGVEAQMSRYGFQPCTDKPDLVLHYHVVIKNEVLYMHNWACMRQDGGPFEPCNRVRAVQYQEGTLIIDFLDAKNGYQVWRGAAVGGLENIKAADADSRIKAATQAIFKKFPEKPIPQVIP